MTTSTLSFEQLLSGENPIQSTAAAAWVDRFAAALPKSPPAPSVRISTPILKHGTVLEPSKQNVRAKPSRHVIDRIRSLGIAHSYAVAYCGRFGDMSLEQLHANPYSMLDVCPKMGFKKTDQLAKQLGISERSATRLTAGLKFVAQSRLLTGDCAITDAALLSRASHVLSVPEDELVDSLMLCIEHGDLVSESIGGTRLLYLPDVRIAERSVAVRVTQLHLAAPPWKPVDDFTIARAARAAGVTLSASQKEALRTLLTSNLSVLTGGPGCGKTTLIRILVNILAEQLTDITLCAPMGRAAKRMAQVTGRDAATIHRTLKPDPDTGVFTQNHDNPLSVQLLLVDEVSTLDIFLTAALLDAVPEGCAVIFVGDIDQLASVGPGQILADCIAANALTTVRLTEVHRQAKDSHIIENARAINTGRLPTFQSIDDSDFSVIIESTPTAVANRVQQLMCETLPSKFGVSALADVHVLTPVHKGELGTVALNQRLQAVLNPIAEAHVTFGDLTFKLNDRVLQLVNNREKDVFNGEIGFITAIDHAERTLTVAFDDHAVVYRFDECEELTLAYAMTVHKSQGSEMSTVIFPMTYDQCHMLTRSLLYTAVTRAKTRVIIVCQMSALRAALSNSKSRQRVTGLARRLDVMLAH